jgi:hypothetical protein
MFVLVASLHLIHPCIHKTHFSKHLSKDLKSACCVIDMDLGTRKTKKFTFRNPNLTRLKELGSHISFRDGFQHEYGKLLDLIETKMQDGLLSTLVQFYDPVYHCFTFRDYQLVPTLEEYAYYMGLPVNDRPPFSGLEGTPKTVDIAAALHLSVSVVDDNLITKGERPGLTSDFLFEKAFKFFETMSVPAFEAIFAVLVYGLLLFPSEDSFVDLQAIQIYLMGNPVPTLLGDIIFVDRDNGNNLLYCSFQ